MKKTIFSIVIGLMIHTGLVFADDYRVTTMCASPGKLGFYLRTLIIEHHDTLAVSVGD